MPEDGRGARTLTAAADQTPLRADVFLAGRLAGISRRQAQRALAAGLVRVNGRRARKGDLVRGGDVVELAAAAATPPVLAPNPHLALAVLYEDAAVVALDKPPGMPAHALRPEETDTVSNFLLARYPETARVGKRALEPGIVHRLDTDTSGVLLAARTPAAYAALRSQFAAHAVTKEYLAVVAGDVASPGEVRLPIAHDRRDRRRMRAGTAADAARARPAVTVYAPVERLGEATLLEVQIRTGVRHQIRVHLAAAGYPVVGDRIYGAETQGADGAARQLLHASRVIFRHPVSGQEVDVRSPLPADMETYLARRRGRGKRGGRPS